ncbi:hypothetical protein LZQ00_02980 [Sphingobacterium sp. SRCM116780]|uniref:hypothetical protein n=1 Tax=Sphingobacterium sp. SRCM116780 TaxID=2907623 RepID=UPI001F41052D|nr:hypothetical protein [Sphingobacterium sp. SRCM116780]UIR56788.1 hypothetical protein LZQ00_02980 [Sphingobacterium sp. SRCM116780]
MDKKQYAEHLAQLVPGIEIDIEKRDLSDEFYAYFQCFMPDGKDIEKVFVSLEKGQELLERIIPIYEATQQKTLQQFKEGISPGYFCPDSTGNKELLEHLGKAHIESIKIFSQFLEDKELEQMLENVHEIVIYEEERELKNDYLNSYLYDTISDWSIENEDGDGLISILNEAYYSINCDYYLSYYLRFPTFKNKPEHDFLKSYFEIWKAGYYCKFDKTKLIIYK